MRGLSQALLVLALTSDVAHGSSFKQTLSEIANLEPAQRNARLTALVAAGTPLVDGTEVTFLAEARQGSEPRILTESNGYGRYPAAEGIRGGQMRHIEGTDWFWASMHLAADGRLEYGFSDGEGEDWLDPHNPRQVRTFGALRSVLEMPEWRPSPWVGDRHPALAGTLHTIAMRNPAATDERKIHIYLPPVYPEDAPYPAVYFNDGTGYVKESGVPQILDSLILGGALQPLIAVFVDPINRREEYRGQPEFLDFFVDRLVPWVDAGYATLAEPRGRAIVGGSRGALGALHLAWGREGVFGYCGMLTPAVTPTDALHRVFQEPARPISFWVLGGLYDARFLGDYYTTLDTLLAKGYSVRSRAAPIGHSTNSRRHFLPRILRNFFPPGR